MLAVLFVILLVICFLSHFLSLPGNWFILALFGIWKWIHPEADMGWFFFGVLTFLALVGEGLEHVTLFWSGNRSGGTRKGNIGALVGALVGAVVGAPFFFGAGAIPGCIVGAYLGSLGVELLGGMSLQAASRAAVGAMWGKVFGIIVKMGLGGYMLYLGMPKLFA
ncbi:DUF456 domain-containing protein [Desulfoplanes sp. PS50]